MNEQLLGSEKKKKNQTKTLAKKPEFFWNDSEKLVFLYLGMSEKDNSGNYQLLRHNYRENK